MSQVLYRKYRPKTFSEIEGQEHIVQTLRGALLSGRVGHSYLFAGPRGTGKTTLARLFAKALNCTKRQAAENTEPCNLCFSCQEINLGRSLDLIEIDAASNRGIDEIRNIKESAQVAATSSNYKVFVVDEVHMLSQAAFNALLKIIEEPPGHVIFILATTDLTKVPETVLSRVQRFDLRKLSHEQIIRKLEKVANLEGFSTEAGVLAAVADYAGGSLRDAESILAKLISYTGGNISLSQTREILGIVSEHIHRKFLESVIQKRTPDALAQIASLYDEGVNLENFTKQFVNFLRLELISLVGSNKPLAGNSSPSPQELVKVLNVFLKAKSELKDSPVPQLPLELAVVELTHE